MAYLFLRNVKNVLLPLTSNILAPHHPTRLTSFSGCIINELSKISRRTFQSSPYVSNSIANNIEVASEGSAQQEESAKNDVVKKQPSPIKSQRRFHGIRTRSSHLQRFNETLQKGEVLSSEQAFHFIKSCGPQMVAENGATRNELVHHIWEQLQQNGVALEIPLWNTLLSVYIDNRGLDFEPIDFLSKLWETSAAEPNLTTFNLLIRAYAMKADPVGAMKIVDFMLKNNTKMTEVTYAWLVQAFAKKGDTKAVEEILKTMSDVGIKPKRITYGKLVDAYAEAGDIEAVNNVIMEMIGNKIYPSSKLYVSMLEHLSYGGHIEKLPAFWDKIQDVEFLADDIRPLILNCVSNGNYEFALVLIENTTTNTSGNKNSYHYYIEKRLFNLLHYSRKDLKEYLTVSKLVAEHFGQQPLSRLRSVIDFFISKNDFDSAIGILKSLDAKDVRTQLFHPILKGAADQNNIPAIVDILEDMKNMDVSMDYYCTSIITPALGKPGSDSHNQFCSIVKEKKNINLPFNVLTGILQSDDLSVTDLSSFVQSSPSGDLFTSLVQIKKKIISDFNATDASKIVSILHERGMRDVTILTFEIIRSLESDKKIIEGMHFIKNLMDNNIPISSETYTRVLRALRRNGLSDEFFMFVRIMKEHGVEPDVHQYYQMLNMAAMVGNSMAAQFCFNKVKDSKEFTAIHPRLYNWLIKAYGKDSESNKMLPNYLRGNFSESAQKAIDLFSEMKENKYEPTPFTVSTVIRSYLQNGDFEGANAVIKDFGEGEEKVRSLLQTDFIRAYITHKDYKSAEKLFESLKANSELTLAQYNEMLRMCEHRGDVGKLEELYEDILSKGFYPNASTYAVRIRTYLGAKQPEKCIEIIEENIGGRNDLRVELFMVVLRHIVPTGNVEAAEKMIELIQQHHQSKVPPHRLNEALILVTIKNGDIEKASSLLHHIDDSSDVAEPALNPYRKAAKSAHLDGDVEYIENLMKFLKKNNLYYQTLDTFYLLALNKMNNLDGIKRLYKERIAEGFEPTEKFMSLLHQIIEVRNIPDFTEDETV